MAEAECGQLSRGTPTASPSPITSNAKTALTHMLEFAGVALTQHPIQEHDISVSLYDRSVDELAVR